MDTTAKAIKLIRARIRKITMPVYVINLPTPEIPFLTYWITI